MPPVKTGSVMMVGLVLIAGCIQGRALGAGEVDLWEDFVQARAKEREPILPDFSWAGYRYSERAVPKARGRVFDVTRFGARPDDDGYDDAAVQKTIDAAQAARGGIVFFPPGRFRFCPRTGLEDGVKVTASNIVLRGSGSGEGGTELFIDKMNTKNGSCYFLVAPPKIGRASCRERV